jgi:thioredoxin 1
MTKKQIRRKTMRAWLTCSLLVVSLIWGTPALCVGGADQNSGVPAKGMITMLDIGKGKCIPCKMMAPVLEKLKKEYDGKASIVFIDISKDVGPAVKYGIRAIPTQIFFNEEGNEVYRHVGFMSENDIIQQLEKMGVSRSSGNEG